ncbi:hypothetical protein [Paenibacillus marinisediminis]
MKLRDALFNWLQMDVVARQRPQDGAAKETLDFFAAILKEDHSLTHVEAVLTDEDTYTITYLSNGEHSEVRFDRTNAEQLWQDIESNPKYN